MENNLDEFLALKTGREYGLDFVFEIVDLLFY
jgi:hypothetical protein